MTETPTYQPLTRDQKLQAEFVVQLGNIAEAIRAAARGEDSSDLMAQIETLQDDNAQLIQQLANANQLVSVLQEKLAQVEQADVTPDSIAEIISHLGIEVGEG